MTKKVEKSITQPVKGSVAFLAQKGGSGRSSTTLLLAVAASVSGSSVVLVDYDPQESLTNWFERRAAQMGNGIDMSMASTPALGQLKRAIEECAQVGDVILVDTRPGEVEETLQEIIDSVDVCVAVTTPSQFDIEALGDPVRAIRAAGKPYLVVVNKGNGEETQEAVNILKRSGCTVAQTVISYNKLFIDALGSGDCGSEYDEGLHNEAMALWGEVRDLLASVDRGSVVTIRGRGRRIYSRRDEMED